MRSLFDLIEFNCRRYDYMLYIFVWFQILASAAQCRNLNVQEHVSYTLLNGADIATPK